jgi:hypothetical protein
MSKDGMIELAKRVCLIAPLSIAAFIVLVMVIGLAIKYLRGRVSVDEVVRVKKLTQRLEQEIGEHGKQIEEYNKQLEPLKERPGQLIKLWIEHHIEVEYQQMHIKLSTLEKLRKLEEKL